MANWRTRQRNALAKDMVKKRIKVSFMRDGKMIKAVPTLQEALLVADDIQTLLDVVNGDVPIDALTSRKPH